MEHAELMEWLWDAPDEALAQLWTLADRVRRDGVGDTVHVWGALTVSNVCGRPRNIRSAQGAAPRRSHLPVFRASADHIVSAGRQMEQLGIGCIILRGSDEPGLSVDWVEEVVDRLVSDTSLAVGLSLEERNFGELERFRWVGVDRYLLSFETSNLEVCSSKHPFGPRSRVTRLEVLQELRWLGFEVGSGMLVGGPETTSNDLARDLRLCRDLDLDLIGVECFRAKKHPRPPADEPARVAVLPSDPPPSVPPPSVTRRVAPAPNTLLPSAFLADRVLGLARLMCPRANILSSRVWACDRGAVSTDASLLRGANICVVDFSASLPNIAVGLPSSGYSAAVHHIRRAGRALGTGPGQSARFLERAKAG